MYPTVDFGIDIHSFNACPLVGHGVTKVVDDELPDLLKIHDIISGKPIPQLSFFGFQYVR